MGRHHHCTIQVAKHPSSQPAGPGRQEHACLQQRLPVEGKGGGRVDNDKPDHHANGADVVALLERHAQDGGGQEELPHQEGLAQHRQQAAR